MKQVTVALYILSASIVTGSYLVAEAISTSWRPPSDTANIARSISDLGHKIREDRTDASEERGTSRIPQAATLTIPQAAAYLNVTYKEMEALLQQTDLPRIKLNDAYRIPKQGLDEWLKRTGSRYEVKQ